VEGLLEQAAQRLGNRPLLRWDFVDGLAEPRTARGKRPATQWRPCPRLDPLPANQEAILLLRDFHRYCEDAGICRRLRNLARELRQAARTLVITAQLATAPGAGRQHHPAGAAAAGCQEIGQLLSAIAQASAATPWPPPC
jgi:hypothetical protein